MPGGLAYQSGAGRVGDLLENILVERQMARIAAEREAYARQQAAIKNAFEGRRVGVDEGRLDLDYGKFGQDVRQYDEAAPRRAADLKSVEANTAATSQDTTFEADDRARVLSNLERIPDEPPSPGQLSPRTVFGLKYHGNLDLASEDAQNAMVSPEEAGRRAGARGLSEWRSGGRQVKAETEALEAAGRKTGATPNNDANLQMISMARETLRRIRANPSGFNSAVGVPGWQRGFGVLDALGAKPLAGTQTANAHQLILTLKSQLTLPNLQFMKGLGAMSEKEFETVARAVTALDPSMDDQEAWRELDVIEGILNQAEAKMGLIRGGGSRPADLTFNPQTGRFDAAGGAGGGAPRSGRGWRRVQ